MDYFGMFLMVGFGVGFAVTIASLFYIILTNGERRMNTITNTEIEESLIKACEGLRDCQDCATKRHAKRKQQRESKNEQV